MCPLWIAPHHRDDQFLYFVETDGDFPEFMPMLATGTSILGQVVADVVADYFAYYTHGSASAVDDILHRMRADLRATASKIPFCSNCEPIAGVDTAYLRNGVNNPVCAHLERATGNVRIGARGVLAMLWLGS